MAEETADLRQRYPWIDAFVPAATDISVAERVVDLLDLDHRYRIVPADGSVRAGVSEAVTVQQGCNRRCTYCVIRLRRGSERSRQPEEVLSEVRRMVARGTKEVVLLGQIVDRYGQDLKPPTTLADLLRRVSEMEGLERIRFLTSHPADFRQDLIDAVATLPKVCEDVNLPIQSGDDGMLRSMRRGYTVGQYGELVRKLRSRIPALGLSTDVILGYPGETEQQFHKTLDLLEALEFDVVHVAAFSPRPGTEAARLVDDIPKEVKRRRSRAVEDLQRGIATRVNSRLVGQTLEVLVEGRSRGKLFGRSRNGKLVFFDHAADLTGTVIPVEIVRASPWSLLGAGRSPGS